MTNELKLANHFLIAMPSMKDAGFAGALVYLCEHNAEGALGIVVNREADFTMETLFDQVNIPLADWRRAKEPIYFGGPVQTDRGFVLHRPSGVWASSLMVNDEVGLTTSRDILEALATGDAPAELMITMGYSGWSAGQLEWEISQNAWLTVEADLDLVFGLPAEQRLPAAIRLLGFDIGLLSEVAGHA